MKNFVISPGIHNPTEQNWKPISIKAKTWIRAVNKAIEEKLIPKDAYSINVLETEEDSNEEEEEQLAQIFREWREDQLIEKFINPDERWMM